MQPLFIELFLSLFGFFLFVCSFVYFFNYFGFFFFFPFFCFKEKLADGRIFLSNSAFSYVRNIWEKKKKEEIYDIFVNKAD